MKQPASILGLGTAQPAQRLSQTLAAEASARCCAGSEKQHRLLSELFRQSTVQSRGSVLLKSPPSDGDTSCIDWFYKPAEVDDRGPTTAARMAEYREAAPGLAIEASAEALREAGTQADQVTHLVVVTCTGFASPGVEFELIDRLGLPPNVTRTQIGFMGCHGALNGLQVASAFANSHPAARVLMCCVELCSLHFQYGWGRERLVSNALFADGAAALVVGSAAALPMRATGEAAAAGPARPWQVTGHASFVIPETRDEMSWHIGDHGFEMTLSPRVPALIRQHVRPWLDPWLAEYDLKPEDLGCWAVHPGGPRIVSAVQEALELQDEEVALSRRVLRECGNMSSATLLFILQMLRQHDAALPCVAMSFGPGLVCEAALLR